MANKTQVEAYKHKLREIGTTAFNLSMQIEQLLILRDQEWDQSDIPEVISTALATSYKIDKMQRAWDKLTQTQADNYNRK